MGNSRKLLTESVLLRHKDVKMLGDFCGESAQCFAVAND